jgi:hypothetical protein
MLFVVVMVGMIQSRIQTFPEGGKGGGRFFQKIPRRNSKRELQKRQKEK